jgi:outer membrane protein assembly factor BamB
MALDREVGTTDWSIELETSWAPVSDGDVIFTAGPAAVRAVKASDGSPVWATPIDGEPTAPLVRLEGVLLGVIQGTVRAWRTADGREIWRQELGAAVERVALTAGPDVAVVSAGSRLWCLTLEDGAVRWTAELGGVLSTPVISGNRVFVGSTGKQFYSLDVTSGRIAWRWRVGGDVVGAAVDSRLVYVVALDHLVRALRPGSGNQVWKRELSTRAVAPPVTFGGLVLVAGNEPTLATYNARTGAPLGTFMAPSALEGAPLVDPVLTPFRVAIVALTRDGRAIGLRPTAMMFREPALDPLQALPGRALPRERLTLASPSGLE